MAVSGAKPAGKIPAVQQLQKWPRKASVRRQGALVGETCKPRPQTPGRFEPLSVDEEIPAAKEHPRTQIEAQAPCAAERGKSGRRMRTAGPRKYHLRLGRGQVLAEKTRDILAMPADPAGHRGGLLHHPSRNFGRVTLRFEPGVRVLTVERDPIL